MGQGDQVCRHQGGLRRGRSGRSIIAVPRMAAPWDRRLVMKQPTLQSVLLALLLVANPGQAEAQVKTIAVGGTELAYLDKGRGPAVVMVHGTISDYRWWQAQLDEFSQQYRVVAYSLRHHHPNVSTGDRSDTTSTTA